MTREHHFLVSLHVSQNLHAHAYMGYRCDDLADVKRCQARIATLLMEAVEENVGRVRAPMILLSALNDGVEQVHAVMLRGSNEEVVRTLGNFTSGREPYVFAVWFMSAADPDSEKLMELH